MTLDLGQKSVWAIAHLHGLQIACGMTPRAKRMLPEPEKKEEGRRIGYARVSTDEQELRLQLDALERAGCANIWREKASAFRPGCRRHQLELALVDLRPDDVLVVWRLDRLGRNLAETIKLLDRIRETGAGFKSLTENIDMATPIGRLMFHIIGSFAEFEAASTAQRTKAGMAAMRERGAQHGAKPKLTPERAAKLVADRKAGATIAALAVRYRISTASVRNYVIRAASQRRKRQ